MSLSRGRSGSEINQREERERELRVEAIASNESWRKEEQTDGKEDKRNLQLMWQSRGVESKVKWKLDTNNRSFVA